jgi:hypothetical protein
MEKWELEYKEFKEKRKRQKPLTEDKLYYFHANL